MRRRANDDRDRGAMSMEMVIVTPLLVAFMVFMVGLGRIVETQSQVDGAARDAARAASVARDQGQAKAMAHRAAQASMKRKGEKRCTGGAQTNVDFTHWERGGQVSVTVLCNANLSGLSLIGLPRSKRMTGKATVPLDTFRRVS